MTKAGDSIIRGAKEALAYARDANAMTEHKITITLYSKGDIDPSDIARLSDYLDETIQGFSRIDIDTDAETGEKFTLWNIE